MHICLFGNFKVEAAVRFQSDKIRAMFAYIAIHAGKSVPRGSLVPLLWGGFPDKAASNNARISLSRLKKAMAPAYAQFGDKLLQITRKTVQLNLVEGVRVDVVTFEQLWARCEKTERTLWADRGQVIHALTELVELYRGPFLDGFILDDAMEFDEWVTIQRESAHQRVLIALETLTEHHLAHGNWDDAQQYAERQLVLEPWHELAHRQLIQAHHRAGRRDAALAQYERCQEVLWEELGAEPSQPTVALYEAIQQERTLNNAHSSQRTVAPVVTSRLNAPIPTVRHNLPPQLTPLIGREAEMAQLKQILAGRSYRLLTLLGHGGIGKTRLALALGESQLRYFAQGVFFVPLTATTQASGMVEAIADALGMSLTGKREPLAQVSDYLRERETLLILDNMEQLIDEDATIDALLALLEAAPHIVLVVTSRQRVWIRAETVIALGGLSYPPETPLAPTFQPPTDWQAYDALKLFIERMEQASIGYDPTDELPYITQICQLVDGLPLALELAATQSCIASCAIVAEALVASMGALKTRMRDMPKRQRSLQAVFNYSWHLLNAEEQAVLTRLSIFRGGFDWDAVDQIVPEVTKALLKKLIGHSLLRQQPSGRYDQHEMVRQFAATHLDQETETTLEKSYIESYLAYLAAKEAELEGREPHLTVAKLLPDFNNLQHAWRRGAATRAFASIQPAIQALSNFLQLRGLHHLG